MWSKIVFSVWLLIIQNALAYYVEVPESPLSSAAGDCDLTKVKLLLADGADAKYDYSDALFNMECETNEEQREMARLLLRHCADPDADKPGRRPKSTPFKIAVYSALIGEIREMAVWMKEVPKITIEDVSNAYKDQYNDIVRTINEAREERKILQEHPPSSSNTLLCTVI